MVILYQKPTNFLYIIALVRQFHIISYQINFNYLLIIRTARISYVFSYTQVYKQAPIIYYLPPIL